MQREAFISAAKDNLKETAFLFYVDGYKYQSRNDMVFQVFIYPERDIVTDRIILRRDGWLWVSKYFAWDGASGPTIDTPTNVPASLCHDALYALMRMGLLSAAEWRSMADEHLGRIMIRDGAYTWRADYYVWAVRKFAGGNADPKNARKIKIAPHAGCMPGLSPA